ncbi:MAG: TDP-N-acetylfucosamine:lipid II N-acetylfucosaminyltransferase [Bacteroidales bacterium]
MSKKFIHIAFDSIFLDYTIEQFETIIPGNSQYFIDVPNTEYNIKHIKNVEKINTIVFNDPKIKDSFIRDLNNEHIVILHCLNQNMIDIVNKATSDNMFVWIVWGAEVNSLPLLSKNNYQPYTKRILKQINNPSLKSILYQKFPKFHQLLYKIKNGQIHPTVQKIKAINRINYAGIFVKEDFDIFNSTYHFNLKWLWYCYYNIEDTVGAELPNINQSNNILIGNSSNPTNNHIDAFHWLKEHELGNRKIFCPLSYGTDSTTYVENVIKEGTHLFGDNFVPLKDFLPLEKYNEILATCSLIIMNQTRQQAVGNIITSLWNGAKLFLNEENPVYKHLIKIGVKVYSIQNNLCISNQTILASLNEKDILDNRNVLMKYFSKNAVLDRTRQMIQTLWLNEN